MGVAQGFTRSLLLNWLVVQEDGVRFNPMSEISNISPRPLLVIAGDADEGIDLAGVRRLLELAREPKELVACRLKAD